MNDFENAEVMEALLNALEEQDKIEQEEKKQEKKKHKHKR